MKLSLLLIAVAIVQLCVVVTAQDSCTTDTQIPQQTPNNYVTLQSSTNLVQNFAVSYDSKICQITITAQAKSDAQVGISIAQVSGYGDSFYSIGRQVASATLQVVGGNSANTYAINITSTTAFQAGTRLVAIFSSSNTVVITLTSAQTPNGGAYQYDPTSSAPATTYFAVNNYNILISVGVSTASYCTDPSTLTCFDGTNCTNARSEAGSYFTCQPFDYCSQRNICPNSVCHSFAFKYVCVGGDQRQAAGNIQNTRPVYVNGNTKYQAQVFPTNGEVSIQFALVFKYSGSVSDGTAVALWLTGTTNGAPSNANEQLTPSKIVSLPDLASSTDNFSRPYVFTLQFSNANQVPDVAALVLAAGGFDLQVLTTPNSGYNGGGYYQNRGGYQVVNRTSLLFGTFKAPVDVPTSAPTAAPTTPAEPTRPAGTTTGSDSPTSAPTKPAEPTPSPTKPAEPTRNPGTTTGNDPTKAPPTSSAGTTTGSDVPTSAPPSPTKPAEPTRNPGTTTGNDGPSTTTGSNVPTENPNPTRPAEPTKPAEPTRPAGTTGDQPSTTGNNVPTENPNPTRPAEPTKPAEPTRPAGTTTGNDGPSTTGSNVPTEIPNPTRPAEPTKPAEPTRPSGTTGDQPSTTGSNVPTEIPNPTRPAEPTKPAEPTRSAGTTGKQPTEIPNPTRPAEPTKPAVPTTVPTPSVPTTRPPLPTSGPKIDIVVNITITISAEKESDINVTSIAAAFAAKLNIPTSSVNVIIRVVNSGTTASQKRAAQAFEIIVIAKATVDSDSPLADSAAVQTQLKQEITNTQSPVNAAISNNGSVTVESVSVQASASASPSPSPSTTQNANSEGPIGKVSAASSLSSSFWIVLASCFVLLFQF